MSIPHSPRGSAGEGELKPMKLKGGKRGVISKKQIRY